jgi:ribosomal protein S18 acetylase RimI-like enzyme
VGSVLVAKLACQGLLFRRNDFGQGALEMPLSYDGTLEHVDWPQLKAALAADQFDNGRSAELLAASFANSYATCICRDGERVVGTARVLSDGVCNAYMVDVWTSSSHRRQGIARRMVDTLLTQLPGQHVYLFTDDAAEFYLQTGWTRRGTGFQRVVGEWLNPTLTA